jgi:hypothetical protein
LYNSNYDDTYFVTCFVAGLKEEIRSMICLHRPKDVDTACALALIQEEELSHNQGKLVGKEVQKNFVRLAIDKAKLMEVDGPKLKGEDKLSLLRDFRRKNGLCFCCGEKWGLGHECPPQVPLHVIEEILDALEVDGQESDAAKVTEVEEVVLAVGQEPKSGPDKRRTMKICGKISKIDVLILIDFGSVGTFISNKLA